MRRQRQPGGGGGGEGFSLLLLLLLLLPGLELRAEIAHSPLASNRISSQESPSTEQQSPLLPQGCAQREAYEKLVSSIDDVEDLYVDVPVHIALEQRQKKR